MTRTEQREWAETLAARLKARQDSLGITQMEAAAKCGVHRSIYCRWVNGRAHPSFANIDHVATFLEAEPDEVLGLYPSHHRVRGIRGAANTTDELDALRMEVRVLRNKVAAMRAELDALIPLAV